MSVGEQIRELRTARGLSQVALGRLVGTDGAHVSRMEAGQIQPQVDTLQKLATALGAPLTVDPE